MDARRVGGGQMHARVSARADAGGRWCGGKWPARDTCPLVEDSDAPVETFVDLDHRVRIAPLLGIGQELDLFGAEGDRVVVAHGAPVLEAEDGVRIEARGPGTIGGGRMRRRLREACIVASQEAVKEGIGPRAVDDASETQFGPQAILEGPKEPLDAPLRLRALSRDPVDGEFGQGPGDLRGCGFPHQLLLEGQACGLAAVKDAVAITVDCDRDAFRVCEGVQDLEVAVGIFLFAKRGGEDLAGRIIDGRDQGQARTALVEPGVGATVELDEEAGLRHPLTTSAVARRAATPRARQACRTQDAADGGPGEDQSFALDQELVEVMIVEADVELAGEAHNTGPDVVRDAVDGETPVIPMDESGQAPGLQSCAQAADLAHRSSQEFGGLGHQQFATVEGMEDFQTLFGTVRQGNHASPGSTQAREDIFADPLGRTLSLTYHIQPQYP